MAPNRGARTNTHNALINNVQRLTVNIVRTRNLYNMPMTNLAARAPTVLIFRHLHINHNFYCISLTLNDITISSYTNRESHINGISYIIRIPKKETFEYIFCALEYYNDFIQNSVESFRGKYFYDFYYKIFHNIFSKAFYKPELEVPLYQN